MGILVSWINSTWSQLTEQDDHSQAHSPAIFNSVRSRSFDIGSDRDAPLPPVPSANRPIPSLLTNSISSLATAELPVDSSRQSPASPSSSSVGLENNTNLTFVSPDYSDGAVVMAEDAPLVGPSVVGRTVFSGSPPPPSLPNLRIDVTVANDPTIDHEMADACFVTSSGVPDASADLCFDDEGLSALEKIYLFARSNASFHRVFISRSLLQFLLDVPPSEAVEYVIPLMNGLAVDEDEAVKEALVEDLVSSIWWFLTHCQVVNYEVPENAEESEVTLLNVQSFTPLLGTLLLNPNANVNALARHCVVNMLTRIRDANTSDAGLFGPDERRLFENELIQQVVIGMAHLDAGSGESPANGSNGANAPQYKSSTETSETPSFDVDLMKSPPPPSAADDDILSSALTSSAHALATIQFLAQEEPSSSRAAALAASIQRPPSPIPLIHSVIPIPEFEPQFANVISRPVEDDSEDVKDHASPMKEVMPLPSWIVESVQALQNENENSIREHDMQDFTQPEIQSPLPERAAEAQMQNLTGDVSLLQPDADRGESNGDFNEEQTAIGKLASMSLIAAVTASGSLDQEFQHAFVAEVGRTGRDSVYWVRREATFALGALAKVVPEELLYASLLPLFVFLCEDPVWNVRQSVLFALPAILSRMPSDSRRTCALHSIERFSIDPAPQVRTAVLEVLGEVIYSFYEDEKDPPDEIVRLFIGEEGCDWHGPGSAALEAFNSSEARIPWADSIYKSRFSAATTDLAGLTLPVSPKSTTNSPVNPTPESDPARPLICAFNLPAVALTLGASRWPELRGLYVYLARTGTTKVRQTLAASIGEIARIIGPENARRDLMYRWWDFARGRDAVVRTKAVESLEVLLQMLDTADRVRIVGSLEEIWDNHLKGWREREVLAKRLDRLALLFPNNGEVLRVLLRRALRDATAAVRNACIEVYPRIYGYAVSHPEILKAITEEVSSLAFDESFKKRLTYVECAKSLITKNRDHDRFMDDSFWHSAVPLSSDKIVDVRIALARLLGIVCDQHLSKAYTLPGGILNIVRKLSEDPVADVRAFVAHILAPGLRPPTDFMHISHQHSASMATFSRPPPRREPKTIVTGMKDMKISGAGREQERRQSSQSMVGAYIRAIASTH